MSKIVILTYNFPPESVGGASRIYEMAKLLKNSYQVSVVTPPPTYPFTKYPKVNYLHKQEKIDDIDVHRIWTYQPSNNSPSFFSRVMYYLFFPFMSSFFLFKILKDSSYVIISTPPSSLLLSKYMIKLMRKKIIVDVRDLWVDAAISLGYIKNESIITKIAKRFEINTWKNCFRIITNSMIIQDEISKQTGRSKSSIFYFPFNVDTKLFCPLESTKHGIIYIGNFGTAQNLESFIKAIQIVSKKIPDIKVRMFGGGDQEVKIKELIELLHLESFFEIHDPVERDKLSKIISDSSIGIVPLAKNDSLWYAIPTKTFEYLACGTPILAYGNSNELKRIINESQAGIFLETDVPESIAEGIIELLYDENKLKVYSKNGRKFVENCTNSLDFLENKKQ